MFTEEQKAALDAPLDKRHVRDRQQAGRTLYYLEAWWCIAEANRIFGFDGWARQTVDAKCVAERERKIGKDGHDGWGVSYVGKVRVTVLAGEEQVVREGTGAGHGIDADLGLAHESAVKEMESDALKRALMTFGNPFGLALYDKSRANVAASDGRASADDMRGEDGMNPAERLHRGGGRLPEGAQGHALPAAQGGEGGGVERDPGRARRRSRQGRRSDRGRPRAPGQARDRGRDRRGPARLRGRGRDRGCAAACPARPGRSGAADGACAAVPHGHRRGRSRQAGGVMSRRPLLIRTDADRHRAMVAVRAAPKGAAVSIRSAKRTDEQSELFHARLAELARSEAALARWGRQSLKRWKEEVMRACFGTRLRPSFLDPSEVHETRISTTELTVEEFCQLIDYLFSLGSAAGHEWAAPPGTDELERARVKETA